MNNQSSSSNHSTQFDITNAVFSALSHWWIELLLLAPFVTLGLWSGHHFGRVVAGVLVIGLAVIVLAPRPCRRALRWLLHQSRIRRQLDIALVSTGGVLVQRRPRIAKIERTTYGERVTLYLSRGTSAEMLDQAMPVIATSLRVGTLRMSVDSRSRNVVQLSLVRRDGFGENVPPCPLLLMNEWSLWESVPVGFDEERRTVTLQLPEHNLLLGGEPGAGKSVALSVLVAAAALDPSSHLWLFDGKQVELAAWTDCAERFIGPDVELAITVLNELREIMDRRYYDLAQRGLRKVAPGSGFDLHVVVIDELALFVAGVDRNAANRFADALRDLVARGRAAGIIVLAATQKPSADIVPTALRDLFGYRWALRCATRDASDTVLGSGWATQGHSAADFEAGTRGVGLLLHDAGSPERLRSFHLTDDDVRTLAARATALRSIFPQGHERGGQSW